MVVGAGLRDLPAPLNPIIVAHLTFLRKINRG